MENIFYKRVLELAEKCGKSINQIERELGYPRNALHNYKYGNEPSASRVVNLSDYFNVSPKYLLGIGEKDVEISIDILFKNLSEEQKKELSKISYKWLLLRFYKMVPLSDGFDDI